MPLNNERRRMGRYPVADDRFSECGTALLDELDWERWVFCPGGVAAWLMVRSKGSGRRWPRWHKVCFKRRRRGMPSVLFDGELCWLVEEPRGEK